LKWAEKSNSSFALRILLVYLEGLLSFFEGVSYSFFETAVSLSLLLLFIAGSWIVSKGRLMIASFALLAINHRLGDLNAAIVGPGGKGLIDNVFLSLLCAPSWTTAPLRGRTSQLQPA
jgi:hypothetical protein